MRTRRKSRQVAAARINQLIAVDCLGEIDDRADAQLHRQVLLQDLALLGKIMPTVTEEALDGPADPRVVTGHDNSGRAIVKIDEIAQNIASSRPGASACVAWTTENFPVDNTGAEVAGLRKTGTTLDNGTVFRVLELAPGVSPRN